MAMDTNNLERIEKYLAGRLSEKENKLFEQELHSSEGLAKETKEIAYIIHSINAVGLKRDNEKIKGIFATVSSDYKRYFTTIAAMVAVIFTFAAVVSVPTYRYVIKPIINKVLVPQREKKNNVEIPVDTIQVLPCDSLDSDSVEGLEAKPFKPSPSVVETSSQPTITGSVEKEEKVIEAKAETISIVLDTTKSVVVDTLPTKVVREEIVVEPHKPTNRIVSYSQLKNYSFGTVTARREGNNVVCSFTMCNEVEDAKIQMHSARAKDSHDRNYPAKSCLLNGQSKRIIEKWEKGKEYMIEITILDIPNEVSEFKSISFSFQSEGDSLKQNSQSIILKIDEI